MSSAWTWLVYLATENNVTRRGAESIEKMRLGLKGAGAGVRVLVQQDASGGCVRWEVRPEGPPLSRESLGAVNSGDPNVMLDFLKWGAQLAPAERYTVIIWSHGTGWEPGEGDEQATAVPGERSEGVAVPYSSVFSNTAAALDALATDDREIARDDGTGQSLDTIELGRVLGAFTKTIGRPVDLLVMNACQMASLEVAYQLREYVGCFVASEVNMSSRGLPYDTILPALAAEPGQDGAALAALMVERYRDYFQNLEDLKPKWGTGMFPPGASLSAVQLSQIAPLAEALAGLSAAIKADLRTHRSALAKAVRGVRPITYTDFNLRDLGDLCAVLLAQPELPAPTRAAAEAVQAAVSGPPVRVARGATSPFFEGYAGLTIFAPPRDADGRKLVSDAYQQLDAARATGWGELLAAWHAA